ncbi:MAG: hypothetical protein J5I65_04235 [Aridibacter famidurans]|nr:hypothetical protein [Aridibacter famidurans]
MGLKFRISMAIATCVLGVSVTYLFQTWFISFEEIRGGKGSLCGTWSLFQDFESADGEKVELLFAYFFEPEGDAEKCFNEKISDPANVVLQSQNLSPGGSPEIRRVVTKRIVFHEGRFAPVYSIILLNNDQIVIINSTSLRHAELFEDQRTRELR